MMLAISTNSFHYKYYRILRKMWSFQEREERTSHCLYTQFLFWMTFLTILVSPLTWRMAHLKTWEIFLQDMFLDHFWKKDA